MFSSFFATMPRYIKVVFVVLGIVIVIGAQAGGVTYYMNNLQEKVQTVPVVRAKADLLRHKVLTESDLEVKNVRIEDTVKGYIRDLNELVGQELTEPIAAREQFTSQKIGRATKKDGEITIEIPATWVLSYPQSLRSFDSIALWEVIDPSKINGVRVQGTGTQATTQTTTTPPAGQTAANAVGIEGAGNVAAELSNEPFLEGVTVAYFKDSASNDVQDTANSETPRITASSVGTKIEVNITPEQFGNMRAIADKGYKFIIGYQ